LQGSHEIKTQGKLSDSRVSRQQLYTVVWDEILRSLAVHHKTAWCYMPEDTGIQRRTTGSLNVIFFLW